MARANDRQVLTELEKLIPDGCSKLRLSGCSCDEDDEGINAVLICSKPGNLHKIQMLISEARKPTQSLRSLGGKKTYIMPFICLEILVAYLLGLWLGITGSSDWILHILGVAVGNLGGWLLIG